MPEFYIKIARKKFFPNFRGARAPLPPVSYAYYRHLQIPYVLLYFTRRMVNSKSLVAFNRPHLYTLRVVLSNCHSVLQ